MQSHNLQRQQLQTVSYFNYLGQQYWQDSSWRTVDSDSFSFLGFGANDPVEKRMPTSGEYEKTVDRQHVGRVDRSEYYWTGDYQGGTAHEGPIDSHVGLLCTSLKSTYSAEAYNKALTRFYDKIRETETNLALTLGEGKESVHMIRALSSMDKIVKLAIEARRKLKQNPSLLMSEIWLGYQLGWKPLYNDVYNWLNFTYQAFAEGVPVRARASVGGQYSDLRNENPINSTGTTGTRLITGKRLWSTEIKVWAGIDDDASYNRSQITSLNPLTIAWELTPLSFFVDYFYNIGGYLQNMENFLAVGLTFKRGYVTEMYFHDLSEIVGQSDPWNSNYNGNLYYQAYHVHGRGGSYYVRKRRTVLAWFPIPRAPTLKVPLGWQKLLTTTALFRSILLGGVKGRRV